ncbi:predicted protein [Naegleria gruberi]|uniref:Predicted protein n=1 Tax=Naegleria gruberi TaxID=5762 RepID=D2V524_NAEGR|nr:uncharacterized protein NAEGRDRAFT_63989 [Naegleria gruberi]EFC48031.1 predicted protein [Naegleria gruberi]|eukprot:XP_002680775.1 predicted protein [Naegleria gruberi strain NEG-M]
MLKKLFPSKIANNDRIGFGYFYDRYYTNAKRPGMKIFLFYAAFIVCNYYPCKFIYRYIYEHPYWEKRQIEKDKQKEIRQAILMSSSRDRREDLRDFYKEYYLTQLLINSSDNHTSQSPSKHSESPSSNNSTSQQHDIISKENDDALLQIIKTWNVIGEEESNLISRIIRTNEVLQLFPNRK